MTRYGQAFKEKVVARLLPPGSSAEEVYREPDISTATLERWCADVRLQAGEGRKKLDAFSQTEARRKRAKGAKDTGTADLFGDSREGKA